MRGTVVMALLSLAGCASTRLVDTWHEPSVTEIPMHRVVAVAMLPSDAQRRSAEDVMVARLDATGLDATAAYRILDEQDIQDVARMREKLGDDYDGIFTMRLVDQYDRVTYMPPSPTASYGFWGWYDWAAPYAYDPGYYDVDRVVSVETNLYDLHTDELVWTGLSETIDPESARGLTDDVLQAVGDQIEVHRTIVAP